jgi:hypothetical protein
LLSGPTVIGIDSKAEPCGAVNSVNRVVQVPTVPGRAQPWHPSLHAVSQHTASAQLPVEHSLPFVHPTPLGFFSAHSPVDSTQNWLLAQAVSLMHLGMQDTPEHTNPTAQSAAVVQLALHVEPEQMKLPVQVWGLRKLQTPTEQVPGSTTLLPEQEEEPHDPLGNEQVLLVWQVPLQAASAPGAVDTQSVLVQQPLLGMHAPVVGHTLKPEAVGQPQTPAPVQVWGLVQATGVATLHTPAAEHVPVPPRWVASVHLRVPQAALVG